MEGKESMVLMLPRHDRGRRHRHRRHDQPLGPPLLPGAPLPLLREEHTDPLLLELEPRLLPLHHRHVHRVRHRRRVHQPQARRLPPLHLLQGLLQGLPELQPEELPGPVQRHHRLRHVRRVHRRQPPELHLRRPLRALPHRLQPALQLHRPLRHRRRVHRRRRPDDQGRSWPYL
jgi:hypothetical protein